ncbi:MAG: urate hydroxylase PuuD [Acidobacteria bacterium]|nr:urate hydroxylase PuuD [Acidobacteriota bacterium]
MALQDLYSNIHLLMRWLHVIAGITWIGHLYFFNFVNVPLQAALDDAGKKAVNPQMMPRTLWWFRWGAMITLLAGLWLFVQIYLYIPGEGFAATSLLVDAEGMTDRSMWILFGMLFGIIMWFNVWIIIWPIQKKILGGTASAEELPKIRRRAFLASRANTYLSGPMLFGMLAPSHYGAINWVTALIALTLGLLAIHHSIRSSSKVGKSV